VRTGAESNERLNFYPVLAHLARKARWRGRLARGDNDDEEDGRREIRERDTGVIRDEWPSPHGRGARVYMAGHVEEPRLRACDRDPYLLARIVKRV
jgi:hypothetical protein